MATFVLVHGAWHHGGLFDAVAAPIRAAGHEVRLPTLAGNGDGDDRGVGLEEAIASLVDYFDSHDIDDAILMGHSYGGMLITGAANRLAEGRVRRLVYWSAFVPNDGECLEDMVPPAYRQMFGALVQPDGGVMLPFPVWREAFINDGDLATAQASYDQLAPHPYKTFTDKISLTSNPAEWQVGKSYIHCQEDVALPAILPWHPRLSQKLGLYRYVWMPGSHEVCFTNPTLLAEKIMEAGRD